MNHVDKDEESCNDKTYANENKRNSCAFQFSLSEMKSPQGILLVYRGTGQPSIEKNGVEAEGDGNKPKWVNHMTLHWCPK